MTLTLMQKAERKLVKLGCDEVLYRNFNCFDEEDMQKEGMTREQYLLREAEWVVEDFEDDAHCLGEDLISARELLKETKNGKCIPFSTQTFRPLPGYAPRDIAQAVRTINEYKNTKKFVRWFSKELEK